MGPQRCAAGGVVGDVVEGVQLVGTIGDRGDLEAFGPNAAFGGEMERRDRAGGTGLRESSDVADVGVEGLVVGAAFPRVGTRGVLWEDELREEVEVVVVDGASDHFDPLVDEGRDELVACDKSCFRGERDRGFGVGFGECTLSDVFGRIGRVVIVAVNMFAVVAGTPAAFIAADPCAVGVAVEMIPAVPCIDDANVHWCMVQRKKPTGWNPWASRFTAE